MGLFAPVYCGICGDEIKGKKYYLSDGAMCKACRLDVGDFRRDYSVEKVKAYKEKRDYLNEKMKTDLVINKELYEKFNKTRTLPGDICVDDENQLWYWEKGFPINPPKSYPDIAKFSDILNVWCEVEQGGFIQSNSTGFGTSIKGNSSLGAVLSSQSTSGRIVDQSRGYVRYNFVDTDGKTSQSFISCNPAAVYEVAESLKGLMAIAKGETPGQAPTAPSAADELRQFKALLDDGIITQEEFEAKKQKLLDA